MKQSPKIDTLPHPPEVGKYYLVPHVQYYSCGVPKVWVPIIPNFHEDKDLAHGRHYHPDTRFAIPRFMPREFYRRNNTVLFELTKRRISGIPDPLNIVYKRKKCLFSHGGVFYWDPVTGFTSSNARDFYNVHMKKLDLTKMKCPHRGFDLRSCPVINGKIECPLHGLTWHAATGVPVSFREALNHQKNHV